MLSWGAPDWTAVAGSSALFFANHLFSYFANPPVSKEPPNLGTMMVMPYVRIVPMHAFIMAGAYVAGGGSGIVLSCCSRRSPTRRCTWWSIGSGWRWGERVAVGES